MNKVKTSYVAILTDGQRLPILMSDISRIDSDGVLACVAYGDHCSLYYNEGGFTPQELERAGYHIVKEVVQEDTYIDEKTVYKDRF